MAKEKSAGAVIYRMAEKPLYLLLHYPGGHWGFPKGHREIDETKEQTARREIQEETSLKEFELFPDFVEKIQYFYSRAGKAFNKTVHYFIARTFEERVVISDEHIGFEWVPFKEAFERLTFDNDKNTITKAKKFIHEKEGFE